MVRKIKESKSFYDNDNIRNKYIKHKGFEFEYSPRVGDTVCFTGFDYEDSANLLDDDSTTFYNDLGIGKIKDWHPEHGLIMYTVELENGDIVELPKNNICPYFG